MQDDLPTVPDTVQYVCALTAIEKNISVRDRELLAAHCSGLNRSAQNHLI